MRARQAWALRAGSFAVLGLLVLSWSLLAATGWISPAFLPPPGETWQTLADGMAGGELARRTALTIERMGYGWLLSSLAGIALGALVGLSASARTWLLPSLELLRPLPASSLVPVGIALIGLSNGMVIAAIVFGAIWPVLLATAHGFTSVDPRLREVARLQGFSRFGFACKFGLPNASPDILAGMRLSLTASLIVAIVGEMLSAQDGLGTTILLAARSFRAADLYAGVIMLAAIGFTGSWVLERVERRLLRWRA